MCRTTQVFCGSLVVFLLSSYTTAMIPSWLSAVSFKCHGEGDNCAGALIDKQWIVTTASCFQKCNGSTLQRFKAFLNIPVKEKRRIKNGTKVSVEDVWIHPRYDSITYANNLALVKLECHDLILNIDANFTKANCSMLVDYVTQNHSGYLHSSKKRFRSRELSWEMDSEGNVTLSRCSIGLGMDTIYYCANKPVAVSSNKMSECVKRRRIVPTTPICYHNEWIISVMQDNKAVCTPSTDVPLPTDKPTPTPDISTDEPTLAPTSNTTSMPTNQSGSTANPNPETVRLPPTEAVTPQSTETVRPQPSKAVTPQPTEVATPQSTKTVRPQPTEVVTPWSTKVVSPQPTEVVTPQATKAVNPQSTEAVTPQSTEAVTPQPTEFATLQSTETVTPQSTEAVTSQSTKAMTPQSTEAMIPQPTEVVIPHSTEAVTPQPTEDISLEPVTTSTTPSQTPGDNGGCVLIIDNGKAAVIHNFNDGATLVIEYTCNRGYHFSLNNNKLNRVCINGNMTSKPPPCKPITCRPFEPIANGKIEVTGLTYASVAHFICDPGYYITGSAVRSCDTDGEWNGIEGVCKRKCTVPQSIKCNDGTRVYPTKSAFADIGDVVQYRVPSGYGLIGDPLICQPDSTWSAPPDCLKLCDERQNIPNAVVTINRDIKSYTRKITCNQGYQPDGSDVQSCYFGTWTPIFRSCKRGCSDFSLANGSTTMMLDNQFALMECDKGFHLDPPLVLISCKEGMWLPSIPTCVPDQ
ncbi:uncharacterized protein [Dysidea avara]|uniref:uncharacterized protein n=1 Tax=Dysidea avara TaxID=196820 RepID=UPI003323A323